MNKQKGQGAYDTDCFFCKNCQHIDEFVEREGGGFHHQYHCLAGVSPMVKDHKKCNKFDSRMGFQLGGYWTHMWFEANKKNGCVDWMIASDGEFPTSDGSADLVFHLCDFTQLESFVEHWGKILRAKGLL